LSLGETELITPNTSFMEVAYENAKNHTFEADGYNCWDYSTDLVKELRKNGYIAEIVMGTINCSKECGWEDCTGAHAWVELMLPIEATSGRIITADLYDMCYNFGTYGVPKFRVK